MLMKRIIKRITALAGIISMTLCGAQQASAQYWEAANQLTSLISPALSGSGAYKGSVEVMGVAGLGTNKLNQVEIATSQGYQFTSWFYMGAGLGVSVAHRSGDEMPAYIAPYTSKETGVMIPIFSDFRFTLPTSTKGATTMFIDLRLGASWLCGNRPISLNDNYLDSSTNFYFRPAIGVRIPVSTSNSKQAVNIGLAYMLLTGNNGYYGGYSNGNPTLSAIGATLSFEW